MIILKFNRNIVQDTTWSAFDKYEVHKKVMKKILDTTNPHGTPTINKYVRGAPSKRDKYSMIHIKFIKYVSRVIQQEKECKENTFFPKVDILRAPY